VSSIPRIPGFPGEFLWELDIVERQITALADAFPGDKYDWRPDSTARSVSEVFIHVAAGIFMLLDVTGVAAPKEIYVRLPSDGLERFVGLIRRNDELEKTVREKADVVGLLRRSLAAARRSFEQAGEFELERRLQFFGEETSVRRIYLRLLAHTHEHMGQMIAYLRVNGIGAPWPDWRPDRRDKG